MGKEVQNLQNFFLNFYQSYSIFPPKKINNITKLEDVDKKKLNIDLSYNKKRDLQIYTWGIQKHQEPKCSISFDLTKFTSKTDKDIRNLDGRDEEIQISIINHPKYNELIEKIINEIEENNITTISFFCNHGKHRSVGFAEILKKYYYEKSVIKHLRFIE